jgi:Zn-dependent protease
LKCQWCGKEEALPFKCQFCQGLFCAEHRLPENHNCQEIDKAKMPRQEAPPYEFKVTYKPPLSLVRFRFSRKEIGQLTIAAILVIGVGISIMFGTLGTGSNLTPEVLVIFSIMFVGLFLLHEIAHKLVAQHYGLWAEFRLIMFGAVLTLVSAIPFSPLKIIAPGAMMIGGSASEEIMGKTAVAGPLTNIILALVLLPIARLVSGLVIYIVAFNAWIALINTLPILMLDGLKIFRWNKIVWALVFGVALALTIITFVYT